MKKVLVITFLLIFCAITFGCGGKTISSSTEELQNKPVVYCSFYPLYDFVGQIGREKIELKSIVPFGAEPHGYEPSAKKITGLAKADAIFFIGVGMEGWINKIIDSINNENIVIEELAQCVELHCFDEEHHHDSEIVHEHGEYDPHIWLDPVLAKEISFKIMETLATIDPVNRAYYEKNYQEYVAKLEKLHKDFEHGLAKRASNTIVTTHDAFDYLAKRYGLETYSLMGISANAEPTSNHMAQIIDTIKKHKVNAVFAEELLSRQAAETLSTETGVQVLTLNPIAAITQEQIDAGKDYISIMYENLANLQVALGCE